MVCEEEPWLSPVIIALSSPFKDWIVEKVFVREYVSISSFWEVETPLTRDICLVGMNIFFLFRPVPPRFTSPVIVKS